MSTNLWPGGMRLRQAHAMIKAAERLNAAEFEAAGVWLPDHEGFFLSPFDADADGRIQPGGDLIRGGLEVCLKTTPGYNAHSYDLEMSPGPGPHRITVALTFSAYSPDGAQPLGLWEFDVAGDPDSADPDAFREDIVEAIVRLVTEAVKADMPTREPIRIAR